MWFIRYINFKLLIQLRDSLRNNNIEMFVFFIISEKIKLIIDSFRHQQIIET